MKKKRILKEPIRYSNLFSKVLSINLAIRVMLNQRPSAAAEQMRPSEELCPKSNWSLTNALRNHSDKQGVDELNSIIYQNTLEMMHVQGETAHKKVLCKGGKNAKCFSKLLLRLKATINCTHCCTGSNLSSCRRPARGPHALPLGQRLLKTFTPLQQTLSSSQATSGSSSPRAGPKPHNDMGMITQAKGRQGGSSQPLLQHAPLTPLSPFEDRSFSSS